VADGMGCGLSGVQQIDSGMFLLYGSGFFRFISSNAAQKDLSYGRLLLITDSDSRVSPPILFQLQKKKSPRRNDDG
jgi:hypothetical protein